MSGIIPGMRGTPEYETLMRSPIPAAQRQKMLAQIEKMTARELAASGDFGLVRWFHENGVPQVVSLDREVFVYD
jgi:hypothetical protein